MPCVPAGFEKALEGQLAAGAAYDEAISWAKLWRLLRVPSNWIIILQVGLLGCVYRGGSGGSSGFRCVLAGLVWGLFCVEAAEGAQQLGRHPAGMCEGRGCQVVGVDVLMWVMTQGAASATKVCRCRSRGLCPACRSLELVAVVFCDCTPAVLCSAARFVLLTSAMLCHAILLHRASLVACPGA